MPISTRTPGLVFLLCMVWALPLSAWAQQPAGQFGERAPAAPRSRMRVVESQNTVSQVSYYTIVGGVQRSGVYASEKPQLAVSALIDAAGGLHETAIPSLRIVRKNELRFQMPFIPNGSNLNELLQPGDVVVVPTRNNAPITTADAELNVPVVCLGLLDRPVVLPLQPSINTVNELSWRLGQNAECANMAQVIGPARDGTSAELTAGSVVIFQARYLDSRPLQLPNLLPAPIQLDQVRTSAAPDMLPADQSRPPDAPPAMQADALLSGNLIAPPLQTTAPVSPMAFPIEQASSKVVIERGPTMPEFPALPPIPDITSPVIAAEIPGSRGPATGPALTTPSLPTPRDTPESHPEEIPPGLAQAIGLFAPHPHESRPPVIERQSAEVTTESAPAAPTVAPQFRVSTTERTATSFSTSDGSTPLKPAFARPATAKVSKQSTAAPKATSVWGYLLFCAAALCILTGISLLLSIAFSSAKVADVLPSPTKISAPLQVPQTTAPVPVEVAVPIVKTSVPSPVSGQVVTPVTPLLNGSLPVVEVPIEVPNAWPLHGKAVGHRRLIVNSAHQETPGPHFSRRERSPLRESVAVNSAAAKERQLRDNLRDLCRQSWDSSLHESILGEEPESDNTSDPAEHIHQPDISKTPSVFVERPPVNQKSESQSFSSTPLPAEQIPNPADSQEFDIVLPPSPTQTSALSPLERALRTLASEKRG